MYTPYTHVSLSGKKKRRLQPPLMALFSALNTIKILAQKFCLCKGKSSKITTIPYS